MKRNYAAITQLQGNLSIALVADIKINYIIKYINNYIFNYIILFIPPGFYKWSFVRRRRQDSIRLLDTQDD